MIDIRYHVATLVAVFLALGIGILIGSTLVGDDVLVEQQKKIIDQLEKQFAVLQAREEVLTAENNFLSKLNTYYEDYSQNVSFPVVRNRLTGRTLAIVITGGEEIPGELMNWFSLSGARVLSSTIVLPGIDLADEEAKVKICDYYQLGHDTPVDELRKTIAVSAAGIIMGNGDEQSRKFLEENDLVKFNGDYRERPKALVILGGATEASFNYPESVDYWIIKSCQVQGIQVVGTEKSQVPYSYMNIYQKFKISTVDDVDITPGQVALIMALDGETGNYGIKPTARKFMPSLPTEFLGGTFR